jgi:hypothetical protein
VISTAALNECSGDRQDKRERHELRSDAGPGVGIASVASASSVEFKGQIFRIGLNYKFY